MVSAQKREKLSTLLHSLETEDRKWLQQKLMRQDTASLLRDEKGLSDQELLAAESWYWQQYAESTSMRARRAHARLWCIFMLLRYGGLRLVEALALELGHMDWGAGIIHIQGEHARQVPLPATHCRRLRQMMEDPALFTPSGALLHCDAVQGFLKVPFRAKALGADMISVSAHKIHAAKGTGALYIRPGLPLPAFINGGGQESNYRSGTENMPGICGFGAACADTDAKADIARMAQLRDLAREKLSGIDGLVLIGSQTAPHIVNLSLPGLRSQGIINCLQSDGIYVSAGSACSKGHRSHVLEAMHLSPAVIDGSIRVSFSRDNTEADVDALCQALLHAKQTLKG